MLWEGRVYRLRSIKGVRARIQETGATDLREVPVTELRGLASLPSIQLDERIEKLRVVDALEWAKAQERERVIRESLQGDGPMTMRVETAAKTLRVSTRTIRRLITR